MTRWFALAAIVLLSCQTSPQAGSSPSSANGAETFVPSGTSLPWLQASLTSDPTDEDSYVPAIAPAGGLYLRPSTSSIVLHPPAAPQGPRRVGIQVGHWKTDEVPSDLHKLAAQIGARWEDVAEVDVNLDIANRVAALLQRGGIVVDLLPTTIPAGYVADVFVALHADSDGVGELRGFKLAHGPLRGPFEDRLVSDLRDAYATGVGLPYDGGHISVNMRYYYAFNWLRFQHTTSAHTPAAIIEMGYISSDDDRAVLTEQPDRVATAIANGILRFLNETPRAQIFKDDIVVPTPTGPAPTPP